MIDLRGVRKNYDDKAAVAGIDLTIDRGQVFGLIGPNGAGKTTTLKMLSTLIKPDEGTIEIDGLDICRDVRAIRQIVGYMPDAFGVFRDLDCEDYLQLFGRSHGIGGSELERRVDDVLELTDLDTVRTQLSGSLSMGMRQRLSLAKTLLHDPQVLVLDEPSSGLDPRARIEIRSLLKELSRMGKTIVISSHILADLEEICSNICLIDHGLSVWSGSLDELSQQRQGDSSSCSLEVNEVAVPRASELLRGLECVRSVDAGVRKIEIEIESSQGNRILAALIDADIEVCSFHVERASLESLFLDETTGTID